MQGIYSITNCVTDQVYIGQATDIDVRLRKHFNYLKAGTHYNPFLQRSVMKYGIDKFVSNTVVCGPFNREDLTELEQFYIDKYRAEGKSLFNFLPANNSRIGIKSSDETRAKLSIAKSGSNHPLYGKHATDETKLKMSLAHRGNKANTGRSPSKETRLKLRSAMLGKQNRLGFKEPNEVKKKISLSLLGNQRARKY